MSDKQSPYFIGTTNISGPSVIKGGYIDVSPEVPPEPLMSSGTPWGTAVPSPENTQEDRSEQAPAKNGG